MNISFPTYKTFLAIAFQQRSSLALYLDQFDNIFIDTSSVAGTDAYLRALLAVAETMRQANGARVFWFLTSIRSIRKMHARVLADGYSGGMQMSMRAGVQMPHLVRAHHVGVDHLVSRIRANSHAPWESMGMITLYDSNIHANAKAGTGVISVL